MIIGGIVLYKRDVAGVCGYDGEACTGVFGIGVVLSFFYDRWRRTIFMFSISRLMRADGFFSVLRIIGL